MENADDIRLSEPLQDAEPHKQSGEDLVMNDKLEVPEAVIDRIQQEASTHQILAPTPDTPKFLKLLSDDRCYMDGFRERLEETPLAAVLQWWLVRLNDETRKKFAECVTTFFDKSIFPTTFADGKAFTVGGFRLFRAPAVIAHVKKLEDISDEAKDEMMACYALFVGYVNDISHGWFTQASRYASGYKMAPKAAEGSLSFSNWRTFIECLDDINKRDGLIARCIIQGTLRISEVLGLTLNQIDFTDGTIRLTRKKHDVCIGYEFVFIKELEEYITSTMNQRKSLQVVFVTKNGKPVTRSRLNYSFAQASSLANIKKVAPEDLRSTWVMLKQQGYADLSIMSSKKSRLERCKNMR